MRSRLSRENTKCRHCAKSGNQYGAKPRKEDSNLGFHLWAMDLMPANTRKVSQWVSL